VRGVQGDQAIGTVTERHRPQADGVDQAEDRDVGPDADADGQHRGDQKAWLPPEPAPGMEDVANGSAHGRR
jgi:hypothetical protein